MDDAPISGVPKAKAKAKARLDRGRTTEEVWDEAGTENITADLAIVGCHVWVKENDQWKIGEIAEKGSRFYRVRLEKNVYVERELSEMLGANDMKPAECVDLTKLLYIHKAAVTDMLKQRYYRGLIYTNVGAMLLVVNPYRDLNITGTEQVLLHRRSTREELKESLPHIFRMTAGAMYDFQDMDKGNIAFVISGESGSGKTETTKHIMTFITTSPDGSSSKAAVPEAIMAANPILEAFGNAATSRNNNSSLSGDW
jgi:myosin heavy subunit